MGSKRKHPARPRPQTEQPPAAHAQQRPPRASAAPKRKSPHEIQMRRAALRRRLVASGAVACVVVGIAGVVLYNRHQSAELRRVLTAGSCAVDERTDPTRPAGQNHIASPTYSVNPPAGGDHLGSSATSGAYAGSSVPADGLLVHSLEHGYVVLWHKPDLPAAQLAQLTDFERAHPGDVIVVERKDMPVPVAATAWGHRLLCQEVELVPLTRFFEVHVGHGPEDVARV